MDREKTYKEKFEELARKHGITVREYFMILRLAINCVSGDYPETSVDIANYNITEHMYRVAYRLTRVVGWEH